MEKLNLSVFQDSKIEAPQNITGGDCYTRYDVMTEDRECNETKDDECWLTDTDDCPCF